VSIAGVTFGGFREVMPINGRWVGECADFRGIIEDFLDNCPQILVTHSPPSGILDNHYGIPALTSALMYADHKVKANLFGHVHECGSKQETHNGILFSNAATSINIVEVAI